MTQDVEVPCSLLPSASIGPVNFASPVPPSMITRSRGHARRRLFGSVTTKSTDDWLDSTIKKMSNEKSEKYDYDFKNDRPIVRDNGEEQKYMYEAVPADQVPKFYHTKTYSTGKRQPSTKTATCSRDESNYGTVSCEAVAMNTRSHTFLAGSDMQTSSSENFSLPPSYSVPLRRSQTEPSYKTSLQPTDKTTECRQQRKRPMKQPLLTNYLPVVRKQRTVPASKCDAGHWKEKRKKFDTSVEVLQSLLRFASESECVKQNKDPDVLPRNRIRCRKKRIVEKKYTAVTSATHLTRLRSSK